MPEIRVYTRRHRQAWIGDCRILQGRQAPTFPRQPRVYQLDLRQKTLSAKRLAGENSG